MPGPVNPVFQGGGPGHWDAKIRSAAGSSGGRPGKCGTPATTASQGRSSAGYATSPDGIDRTRYPRNPIYSEHWVEDMMVVKHGDKYYMFAEGLNDQPTPDVAGRVHWTSLGLLDIRTTDGQPIPKGPYGTPTAWLENGRWHLFYEREDRGVWLAESKDLKVWTNVQDDRSCFPARRNTTASTIAMNQVIKYQGRYYAYYHGTPNPAIWSSNLATSTDLIHWEKYPGNPLRPLSENKSSNC